MEFFLQPDANFTSASLANNPPRDLDRSDQNHDAG
jgi:hypothetical protein